MTGTPPRAAGRAEDDPVDRIRRAIATLDEQRRTAAAEAGRALADQAQVQRALDEQHRQLEQARVGITASLITATSAASRVRAESGAAAAAAYEQTAAGLRSALDVLAASTAQVRDLQEASRSNVAQARELLARAQTALDEALRDQIRLLGELERAHRREEIERFRSGRRVE